MLPYAVFITNSKTYLYNIAILLGLLVSHSSPYNSGAMWPLADTVCSINLLTYLLT